MLLVYISGAVTLSLLAAVAFVFFTTEDRVEERLAAVSVRSGEIIDTRSDDSFRSVVSFFADIFKPVRSLVMESDEDLVHRLSLAGYRRPEHVEIYTAAKMLLPVIAIGASTFTGNMMGFALVGGVLGFFGPDFILGQLVSSRQDAIRRALPDALDLMVICMEAGLGIDQALVRIANDIRFNCPALSEELLIVSREQRAGKPRLDAWRSMAARVDLDSIRQFVAMLVQTERFGTPIANSMGQFSDGLRLRRVQAAEELAATTGVKLLFPLVLFIFPSVFVVLLGPAVLNIARTFEDFFR